MLKHEFEERIGKKVTDKEFEDAEVVYMDDMNMNKDEFCMMWKAVKDDAREYMIKMAHRSNARNAQRIEATREVEKQAQRLNNLDDTIVKMQDKTKELHDRAYRAELELLKLKVKHGEPLTDDEKECLLNLLSA